MTSANSVTMDVSAEQVLEAIRDNTESDNPSSFLAVNEGTSNFTLPGRPGVVLYRPTGGFLIQFGGPFAPPESYRDLVLGFQEFAAGQGLTMATVQLQRRDALIYSELGFVVNQVGASYAVDLDTFTLAGSKYMQLRNKIARAFRNGLQVREVDYEQYRTGVNRVNDLWLPLKGEGARPLEYLVGQTGGKMQKHRRLFVGMIDQEVVGYVSYSPVYGSNPGWMHDLSRRLPDAGPGIMEAINRSAIEVFQEERVRWLHFGFTPFTSMDSDIEVDGYSRGFAWFMRYLWEHGEAVYPASTQLAYKQKWTQTLILPEFVAFPNAASLDGFVHIWRSANAMA